MLDKDKVIKIEICTLRGHVLLTVTKGYNFPRRLIKDSMYKASEEDSLIVKGKNLPVFARGAPVTVVAYTRAGDRFSYPGQVAMSAELQLNIYLRSSESKKLPERRRFYKVSAEIPCLLTSVTRNDKYVAIDPPLMLSIQDINIGGIFIESSEEIELKLDDIISVILQEVNNEVELVSKILRIKHTPEGIPSGYGCCFLFLNTRQEEIIANYIHKLQIRQRAIERAEEGEE